MLLFQTRRGWPVPLDAPSKGKGLVSGAKQQRARVPREKLGSTKKEPGKHRTRWIRHLLSIVVVVPLPTEPLVFRGVGGRDRRTRPGQGLHVEPLVPRLSALCSLGAALSSCPWFFIWKGHQGGSLVLPVLGVRSQPCMGYSACWRVQCVFKLCVHL